MLKTVGEQPQFEIVFKNDLYHERGPEYVRRSYAESLTDFYAFFEYFFISIF